MINSNPAQLDNAETALASAFTLVQQAQHVSLLPAAQARNIQTQSAGERHVHKDLSDTELIADLSLDQMIQHGQLVAATLGEWRADVELQAAGLLYSLAWNCVISVDDVRAMCGERVAFLCCEYQRIGQHTPESNWRGKRQMLRRIKHFMLAYRDLDLAFLGAAVLWNRFKLIQDSPRVRQRIYEDEAQQVLGPMLDFLGMRVLKEELDSWLNRRGDPSLEQNNDGYLPFTSIREQLAAALPAAQLIYHPRPQSLSIDSVATKTHSFRAHQILDIDLLVNSIEECYHALYWLHHLYIPIDGGLTDFISVSRMNGYRSLQAAVIATLGHNKIRVNFNICTHEMDEINRWGLAALHLRNKLPIQLPNAWWNDVEEGFRQIEAAPLGALPETLYVFSPHGQLFRFHRGCTVVDYAYHVHSDLAAQCRRFYVNGETVEPATVLHHLDLVELERDPNAPGPTRVWLNAARTSRARSKIDKFLKQQGKGVYHGQKVIDTRLKALEDHYGFNIPEYRVNQALSQEMRRRNLSRMEDLMDEVAAGRLMADRVLHPLFAEEIIRQVQIPRKMRLRPHQLNLAQCCRPRLGDDIIGRPYHRDGEVTRLKIHQADCAQVGSDPDNIPLKWRLQPELKAVAQLDMKALDEDGLLGDAIAQVYAMLPRVTLHKVEAVARNGLARLRFTLEAENKEVLDEIVDALRRLPNRNVDEVRLMSLPLSEREELVTPTGTSGFNPYSRLPVNEHGMFFGRSEELECIHNWLRAGVGVIWLRGQKRVGKTSLLFHLQHHYLDRKEFVPVFMDFQLLGNLKDTDLFFEIANTVYNELQTDGRIGEMGAPLRDLFEYDSPKQLVNYLRGVQSHLGVGRLVLLLDEFSRTTDAYHEGRLDEGFFQRWRGLLLATVPEVNYVFIVQQQTFDSLIQRVQGGVADPSWHLMELGESLSLKPLEDKDARHLIEWPIRNYLEFSSIIVDCIYQLTGGSPFLIQAFCFKLVAHMARKDKRLVEVDEVEEVSMEFMSPNESVFAHLLDLIRGVANSVCLHIAEIAEAQGVPTVSWSEIHQALPNIAPERLHSTLRELCERDILVSVHEIEDDEAWRFANLLFQRWLAINAMPVD